MRRALGLRVVLLLTAVSFVIVGAWAEFAPRSFYDEFPGGGRHWVNVDGPYNEHLVRDVGGLNLGLAVLTIVADVMLGTLLVRTAAVAALVYEVPHLVYHALNLEHFSSGDKVGNMAALTAAVALSVLVLALTLPRRRPASD